MPRVPCYRRLFLGAALGWCCTLLTCTLHAQLFQPPTANRALFEPGAEERYFAGTAGKTWVSGTFGCVRSDGWQVHEGLDIRCVQRDKRGEPTDPVLATADGTVAYVNSRPSLSNYGKYIVLRHQVQGLEVYSLYAHLRDIRSGLRPGQAVKAGETIGIMGRTANTHEGIPKERAHVHFELNLLANDRFATWYQQNAPGERNDHGEWNGQNLLGFDPRPVLVASHNQGDRYCLLELLQRQPELCRVVVRKTNFPWIRRYATLIRPNPLAQKEGVAGYELALNFNGIPFELIPRAASELKTKAPFQLLSVNEAEYRRNPARRLVMKKGDHWALTTHGLNLLELLTF
jgi:peptidoglycan LD-endopeptidase LytH